MHLPIGHQHRARQPLVGLIGQCPVEGREQPRTPDTSLAAGLAAGANHPHLQSLGLRERRPQGGQGLLGLGLAPADLLTGRFVDDDDRQVGLRFLLFADNTGVEQRHGQHDEGKGAQDPATPATDHRHSQQRQCHHAEHGDQGPGNQRRQDDPVAHRPNLSRIAGRCT